MYIMDYFSHAQLSLAAYSNLDNGALDRFDQQESLRQSGFSVIQAQSFSETWRVIDQYNHSETTVVTDPDGDSHEVTVSNGLSVTVFEEATGKRYLAVRGTDDGQDLITDVIDIVLLGSTRFQDQYQSLRDKVQEWLADGTLSPGFTVTGHSLGGFLATGLAAEFPEDVAHAYSYNAPGLGGIADSILETYPGGLLGYVLDTIGIEYSGTPDPELLSSIKADAGEGLLSGASPVALLGRQVSEPVWVHIEDQIGTDDPNQPSSRNHSQQVLTDALAVYDLFATVDPALDLDDITTVLRASTAVPSLTLETVVNHLLDVLGIEGEVPAHDRDELYRQIESIREAVDSQASLQNLQIRPLTDSAQRLALKAEGLALDLGGDYTPADAMAYRYALVHLAPFVITGNEILYEENHNQGGELDRYNPATGEGALSDQYLEDRARMLALKLRLGISDKSSEKFSAEGDNIFIDESQGLQFSTNTGSIANYSDTDSIDQIVFGGSDNSGPIAGGSGDDRIYGTSSDDTLTGNSGADYLEGGTGEDTYHVGSGDVIFDADRQGIIYLNGISLSGEYRLVFERNDVDVQLYKHTSRENSLLLNDGKAIFIRSGSQVTVEQFNTEARPFADGDFGITLTGAEEPDTDNINPIDGTVADDELIGDSSNDYIQGLEGADDLYGRLGADILEGGAGNDYLNSSAFLDGDTLFPDDPGDWLFGGDGDDIVIGNGGDDRLFGGDDTGRDFLSGRSGDDFLDGGPGDDVLSGGSGSDRLMGGDGDDILFGDFDSWATPNRDWSVTPILNERGHIVDYDFQNVLFTAADADDAADVIHGGAGNDYINGNRGDDLLRGNAGHDTILGGRGDDTIYGGSGDDVLYGDSAFQNDDAAGDDTIHGGDGDDQLSGDAGRDLLAGGAGNDSLNGGAGQDLISGQLGDDIASGGADDDFLAGGLGSDVLSGGGGNDLIVANIAAGAFDTDWSFTRNAPANPDNLRDPRNYFLDGIAVDTDAFNNPALIDETAPNSLFGEDGDDDLIGGAGDDFIDEGSSNDMTLCGDRGDGKSCSYKFNPLVACILGTRAYPSSRKGSTPLKRILQQ